MDLPIRLKPIKPKAIPPTEDKPYWTIYSPNVKPYLNYCMGEAYEFKLAYLRWKADHDYAHRKTNR